MLTVSVLAEPTAADGPPKVVVMTTLEATPAADAVIEILADHLVEFKVQVVKQEVEKLPENRAEWVSCAKAAASSAPGTVVLTGYHCTEELCRLVLVEPHGGGYVELPVKIPKDDDVTLAFAVASTTRESLLGPLLPELTRIVRHGENPGPPPPRPNSEWLEQEPSASDTGDADKRRPGRWMRIEAAYYGDYAHPDGHPIHGPWIGLSLALTKLIGLRLSSGWLGVLEESATLGTITTHRLFTALSVGLSLPLGPSRVELAPMGRLDLVFAKADPERLGDETEKQTEVELHLGGDVTWRLPLIWNVEALVGMGLLASLLSHDFRLDDAEVPASSLRLVWLLGLSCGLM